MFFVYKNRFLARQIGPVMAFIPDNISVHVHLLEDNVVGQSKYPRTPYDTPGHPKTSKYALFNCSLVKLCKFIPKKKNIIDPKYYINYHLYDIIKV